MSRLSIPEYAMALAEVASLRSEDPFRKVGAAALDWDNRVIGTAYNGLAPGFDAPKGFWDDRDGRQKFMLHAEVNLCSLFRRGEARLVATTTMPCTACMQTLCAYGLRRFTTVKFTRNPMLLRLRSNMVSCWSRSEAAKD